MKKNTTILLAGTAALFMTACGSSSSDGDTTAPPPIESTPVIEVIDSGYTVPVENTAYSITGDEFYYQVENCVVLNDYKTYWEVYEDNTMGVTYETSYSGTYTGLCDITAKYVPIEAVDGVINAVHISGNHYYDNETKLHYTAYEAYERTLTGIINDGQNVTYEGPYAYAIDGVGVLVSIVEEVPL